MGQESCRAPPEQ